MTASYPRVLAVGDRAVTVELGALLDEETVGRVRALDERLRDLDLNGVLEAVPTFAALMVVYDRSRIRFGELKNELLRLTRNLTSTLTPGRLVEIPTVYDGEDLDEVAAAGGLTRDAVIEAHSSRDYSVLMLGFSPGFAYMGFVDERLRVPRRKTPRTRVPAGSVAIAGAQTGIYPRTLPGGWNLIGRTSLPLFDASHAAPSALMPGDRVRFVPTTSLPAKETVPMPFYSSGDIGVTDAGILTTIQDGGRPGLRRVAVPWTGYADKGAAELANTCVGNGTGAPLIELCGPGLRLVFERSTFVALAGARVTAHVERNDLDGGAMSVPMNVAVRVRPSNALVVTGLDEGARAYVGIAGMMAPLVLGSASADLGSALLRPLASGDRLSIGLVDSDRPRREPMAARPRPDRVRIVLGPQLEHFDERTVAMFLGASWRVGLDSDRVGARLDGPRLTHAGPTEIISDGMVPGCVQVPPDGRPIVMLSDCPTSGGYPKIGCVVSEDLAALAQALPGKTEIRFEAIRVEEL